MQVITFREYLINLLETMPDTKVIYRTMSSSYTVSQIRVLLAKKEKEGLLWYSELMRISRDYVARNANRNTSCPGMETEFDPDSFKLDSFKSLLEEVPATGPILFKDGSQYKAIDIKTDKSLFIQWVSCVMATAIGLIKRRA